MPVKKTNGEQRGPEYVPGELFETCDDFIRRIWGRSAKEIAKEGGMDVVEIYCVLMGLDPKKAKVDVQRAADFVDMWMRQRAGNWTNGDTKAYAEEYAFEEIV